MQQFWAQLQSWLTAHLDLSTATLLSAAAQILILAIAFALARALRRLTEARTDAVIERIDPRLRNPRLMLALRPLAVPALWWAIIVVVGRLGLVLGYGTNLLRIAASLLVAWIAIRASATLVRDPFLAKAIATAVWLIAALDILGFLDPTLAALDSLALQLGTLRISALTVIKAILWLGVLLWAAVTVARLVQLRLAAVPGLSPSLQVLIANLLRIGLIALAVVIGLSAVGIDLTALAFFGGAIGVGIGLGLQKVVSNFVSGIILLLDRSIKPGDVIEIEKTFGWITSLGARYVSVRSRDGKEYLIPNEDLITHRVVNWSYSSRLVRLDVPFGVAYGSDLHQVRALAVAAAQQPARVVKAPAPVCHVTNFGDSAIELLLRFWIEDPVNGTTNVRGEVLLALYDALRSHGIDIPFPQREVRIRRDAAPAGAVDVQPATRDAWG